MIQLLDEYIHALKATDCYYTLTGASKRDSLREERGIKLKIFIIFSSFIYLVLCIWLLHTVYAIQT